MNKHRIMPAEPTIWFRSFTFIVAVIAIGFALQISNGHLNGAALGVLTFALLAVVTGIVAPSSRALERHGHTIVYVTAAGGLVFELALMFRSAPGIYLKLANPNLYVVYLGGVVMAALIASLSAFDVSPKVWLPLLAAVQFTLGVWMIQMSPAPRIDVFYMEIAASNALLHGQNPYIVAYPDIYESRTGQTPPPVPPTRMYGYPPVNYLFAVPGYLAGDVRYSQLVAMLLAALLIGLAHPTQLSAIVAAVFLFTPRTLFVLEQAWTEPFILLLLAGVLFCKVKAHSKLLPVFLGLLISSKQHMFLVIPAISLVTEGPCFRWKEYARLLGKSSVVAGAITLPFLFWNSSAFYRVLTNFWNAVGRADSLSYSSWLLAHGGPHIPPAFDLLITFMALGASLWLLPRSASGFAAATSLTFFVLFLFSIGSFCNYYYMVLVMLCMAVAFSVPSPNGGGQTQKVLEPLDGSGQSP